MNGRVSKVLHRLARDAYRNFPAAVRARFDSGTIQKWFKRAYQAVPGGERAQWLKLVAQRIAGGFAPVSPKSLMPKGKR